MHTDLAGALRAGARALVLVRDNLARTMSYRHVPGPLEALATIAAAAGDTRCALQLAGAAAALRERSTEPLTPHERNRLERWLDPARSALGRRATARAWATGEALGAEAAMDQALSVERRIDSKPDGLSPREREVMQLAAQGMSNRQISQRLVITEGTARVHIEHVLRKLDLHSRSQLAAWAFEHDIYGVKTCLSPDADATSPT